MPDKRLDSYAKQVGISPEALGNATSLRAIEEMGSGTNSRISPNVFGAWFSRAGLSNDIGGTNGSRSDRDSSSLIEQDDGQPDSDVEQLDAAQLWRDQVKGHGDRMKRARTLLCLDCFDVDDLMEMLAEVAVMVSCRDKEAPRNRWT